MCRNCTGKSIGSSRSIHLLLGNPSAHAIEAYTRDSGEARCAKSPHAVACPFMTRKPCRVKLSTAWSSRRGYHRTHCFYTGFDHHVHDVTSYHVYTFYFSLYHILGLGTVLDAEILI